MFEHVNFKNNDFNKSYINIFLKIWRVCFKLIISTPIGMYKMAQI